MILIRGIKGTRHIRQDIASLCRWKKNKNVKAFKIIYSVQFETIFPFNMSNKRTYSMYDIIVTFSDMFRHYNVIFRK